MVENSRHILIVADDREPKNDVLQYLAERPDISVTIKRLPIGDYLVDNRLLFERKTIRDFGISIIDGRLFNRVFCLVRLSIDNHTFSCICIHDI
jgi:DNA excision repair protein ERCC-4